MLPSALAAEAVKFVRLLLKSNRNVLALLWLNETPYLHVDPLGQRLIEHRDLFVSRKAFHSFVGYARGQLKRMRGSSTTAGWARNGRRWSSSSATTRRTHPT